MRDSMKRVIQLTCALIMFNGCSTDDPLGSFPISHHINHQFNSESDSQWSTLLTGEDTTQSQSKAFKNERTLNRRRGILYTNKNNCKCLDLYLYNKITGLRPSTNYMLDMTAISQSSTAGNIFVLRSDNMPISEKSKELGIYAFKSEVDTLFSTVQSIPNESLTTKSIVSHQSIRSSAKGEVYLVISKRFAKSDTLNLFLDRISIDLVNTKF